MDDSDPEAKPAVQYEAPSVSESTGDVVFEALWSKVLESWDDDKTHASLLDYAIQSERLSDAAGRYRALKDDPEKGERAKKRLDAIVLAAMQMMMSMKTPGSAKVPLPITLSAAGIFVFMALFVAYAVLHRQ